MIKHLCFSGGGIRGISYLGVLKYLEELDILKNIESIAGTSIGALIASLIILGYTSDELYQLTLKIDFGNLQNMDITQLITNFGLDSGNGFVNLFKILIERKMKDSNITLLQLYEKTGKKLTLVACCLNTGEVVYYDYNSYPNIKLYDAIRVSISIPILFTSPKYKGMNYVDGGLINDFPLDLYSGYPKQDILGIKLDNKYLDSFNNSSIEDIESYLICLFYCVLKRMKREKDNHNPFQIILIDTGNLSPIQFNIGYNDKITIYNNGYNAAKLFFLKRKLCNNINLLKIK